METTFLEMRAKEVINVVDGRLLGHIIDVVFDRFGNSVKMYETGNEKIKCVVEVQQSPTFISWCCAFDKKLKVLSPPSTIEKIKEHLRTTLEMYE